ncbi:MAG: tRNA pseudouridine synthase A [Firmicutes bacterium]|nr:tRNA pseudouridine synthase A [Bacillota bacterium]
MRNIKLTVAYDGTDFAGWQMQPGTATIQGALVEVARKITQERILVYGAGRTDSGVHEIGQVAHFKTQSALTPQQFQRAFNALLPPTIRVVRCEEVGPDFHARWQARAKTYAYRIWRGRVVPPFAYRYVLHYPFPLDEAAMAEAAGCFVGEHDFTSFAASSGSEENDRDRNPRREVLGCTVVRLAASTTEPVAASLQPECAATIGALQSFFGLGDELVCVLRGKSFLRYMVRKIVGTLLEVGKGRLKPEDVSRLFALRDRSKSGSTLPPQGLCLVAVEYPDPWSP